MLKGPFAFHKGGLAIQQFRQDRHSHRPTNKKILLKRSDLSTKSLQAANTKELPGSYEIKME